MRCVTLATAAALLVSSVSGFNYVIGVGRDEVSGVAGIGFDPTRTVTNRTALPGQDTLVFSFLQGQHQVIQSSFNSPCTPLDGGFQTILTTVANGTTQGAGPIYYLPVANGTQPLWFYDAAGTNCQTGAVLCVNTNETSTENCSAFRAAAIAQGGNAYAAYTLTAHSGITTQTSTTSTSSASATATSAGNTTAAAAIPTFTKASGATHFSGPAAAVGFSVAAVLLALV